MLQIESEINNIILDIPPQCRPTILQYVKSIKSCAEKGELSDSEYLDKIPGIAESIINEANSDRSQYSENLDW